MEYLKLNIQMFAVSAEATNSSLKSDAGNKATIYVKFTERAITDDNIKNNTTTIDLEATYTQDTGSWYDIKTPWFYLEWYDDKRATWTIVADENVQSMARYDEKTLTGTINVPHKDDGTLSGRARGRWVYEKTSTLVPRNGNATTDSKTLTQVPRKNGISSTSAYIQEKPTITIDKKASSSTTTITWSCTGNGVTKSGTVATKTSASSITDWAIPTDVYSCISSTGKTATITLTATTYIGDSSIGTNTTTFTATIKKDYNKPTVSLSVVDVNSTTTNLTGNSSVVVLNASTMRCTYSATAKNGAYIKSANINNDSLTINASNISGTKDFSKPSTNTFTLSASDSRDFSDSSSKTLSKIDYFVPALSVFVGRNTPTDGKVNISFSGKFFNGSFGKEKNTFALAYRYAEKGTELPDWTSLTPIPDGNNISGTLQLEGFNYQKAYTFQVRMSDLLNTITINQDIPVGRPSPWWDKENMYVDGDYYSRNSSGVLEKIPTKNEIVESAYLGQNPDINSLHYKNGIYGIYGCTQAPTLDMGKLEVILYSVDWVTQRFTTHLGNIWQREFTGGTTWGNWERVGKGLTFTVVENISLGAGATYQLTLPEYTTFIEPLVSSNGASYSGGMHIVPDATYNYLTNNDYRGEIRGFWIRCSYSGVVNISEYNHNGAIVKGFRIWYYK